MHGSLMPFKLVPNAAGTLAESHDGHFRFCPAIAQVYRFVITDRRQRAGARMLWSATMLSWQTGGEALIDNPPGGRNQFLFARRWRFSSFP
jgi:hypothetical protein